MRLLSGEGSFARSGLFWLELHCSGLLPSLAATPPIGLFMLIEALRLAPLYWLLEQFYPAWRRLAFHLFCARSGGF